MEPQTNLILDLVLRSRPLRGLGVMCLMVVGLWPAGAREAEWVVESRKAQRGYPVSHLSSADHRPVVQRAVPIRAEVYRGIPRAKVVRLAGGGREAGRQVIPQLPPPRPQPPVRSRAAGKTVQPPPQRFSASPSVASLVRRCDGLALQGLAYKFGAADPSTGGLDCSGAVYYLLRQQGISAVPRTAYDQYRWLKDHGTLNRVSRWSWSAGRVAAKLRPGDLLFWTGTYETGKSPNISHVMIYLGRDARSGKHYMFGASSRRSKGLHGHAVDVYEFIYPREHGKDNFAGFGSVPGLAR